MRSEDRYLKRHQSGVWYYRRRVPLNVRALDPRSSVESSLKTRSLETARVRRDAMAEADTLYWASLMGGGALAADPALARYKAAQQRALALGFVWTSAHDLLNAGPVDEIIERMLALKDRPEASLKVDAEALLGTAPEPRICLSQALQVFLEEIAPDEMTGKSRTQINSYKKVKRRAVKNFIQVVGDKALIEIDRSDALKFYAWWQNRVTVADSSVRLSGNSANRDVGNLRRLYGDYFRHMGDEARENPFRNLSFRDPKALRQDVPPFPVRWLKERFLVPGAFDGLNGDAALLILALIETGCRPSELCNITGDQIHLEGEVPYIEIRFRKDRAIKTESSVRQIPLVGVSLEAFRRAPDGFARYRDKENGFSAAAMKHLRRTGLLPSDTHRVYSLRHSFESRMKEAGLDYELRCLLMGHAIKRPDYGDGGSLNYRQAELRKIELPFSKEIFDKLK
ncbi:MAG: DUF6538 domain-containing protein [Roseibium sp.]